MASRFLVVLITTVVVFVGEVHGTFFVVDPGTVANSSTSTLAPSCVNAIESQVNCDEYLQLQADADIYGPDNTTQSTVCTTACSSSLTSYISNVESNCGNQPLPWDDMPHAYFGKVLQATYNMSCLRDATTGQYCTQVLLGFGSATVEELTLQQACSPCMLSWGRLIQSTSYSNYDDNLAVQWANIQARCGVSYATKRQTADTIGTGGFGYADNYTAPTTCWSGQTYTVVSGDDCGSIAVSRSVSAGTLITLNNILPDCTNLQIGQILCLPGTCTTYSVKPGDSCFAIAAAKGITFTQLLSYNPALNPTCTNLIAGSNICVSVPGGTVYNATAISGVTPTQTGVYATATVDPPASGVAFGTTPNCGKYYQVADGDYCQIVALKNSISLPLFTLINPSIDESCSNLVPGLWYCVQPTEAWNVTTATSTFYTTVAPPAPTDSGASNACYVWYVVKPGDECYNIAARYGISLDELFAWNAGLNTQCTNLIAGDA
ncbi:carbohydrate-binding module family 50 protein [Nemania sp. NC0429]|nr:carbohydrate-binding module family 50 protein [Nemania sp. NC0429]